MHSLSVTRRQDFKECLHEAVGFKQPILKSNKKLFTNFSAAAQRFDTVSRGLATIGSRHLQISFKPPVLATAGSEIAALPFPEAKAAVEQRLDRGIEELRARLDFPTVGRIQWLNDDACTFTFSDYEFQGGILKNTRRRIGHTHHLVNTRLHRLPATDVPRPKRAQQIIDSLPPPLYGVARIVTGLEILKGSKVAETWTEPTALGEFFGAVSSRAAMTNAAIGAAAVGGIAAFSGLAWMAATILAQVAIVDPAIVIGEFCLFGWED